MKAILLGAGRGVPLQGGRSTPKCMLEGLAGWRVLDWILNALREGGRIEDFVLVGGDGIELIQQNYPGLDYVYNADWAREHVIGSLFAAESKMDGGFFFSYSDVVYRPSTVDALRRSPGDITIVVDRSWRERYEGRSESLLKDAEKVVLREGRVEWIGKDIPLDAPISGEFIGLARFNERGAQSLRSCYRTLEPLYRNRPYRSSQDLHNGFLTDLLQEMVDQGAHIDVVLIDGDWAELDDGRDLSQFVFGTKAETLERLRPMLSVARISEGVRLQVGQWLQDPQNWAQSLARRFSEGELAIRSSARSEDSFDVSNAGRYESVIGVQGGNATAIAEAVDQVVASYAKDGQDEQDQVLIQPCLKNVVMSGVMMTRDLDTGADYTVLHYDCSGSTDSVTSGRDAITETVKIYRERTEEQEDPRLAALMGTARELESITGSDALDVEFAFTADEQLHILQVRPIAARKGWGSVDPHAHRAELDQIRNFLQRRTGPCPGVAGKRSILGQMPDWNPAEMIGPFPLPLARSLYESLITNRAWRVARASLGYGDPSPHRLMVTLAGRPYIDVRLSANNLLPASLSPEITGRIVDAGLQRLEDHPQLHDKIEFEIFATCHDFDLDCAMQRLKHHGMPAADETTYRQALQELTANIVENGLDRIQAEMAAATRLAPFCDQILESNPGTEDHPRKAALLLEHTVRDGTIPFSVLARLAFVGTSLLRTLKTRGILDEASLEAFTSGIQTISGEMVDRLAEVQSGSISLQTFLQRYGHLRPGSYDLLSPRYDQAPDLYFPKEGNAVRPAALDSHGSAAISPGQMAEIDRLLRSDGFRFDASHLMEFIRRSIAAREEAKFAFTRNLSAILELFASWGESLGLQREELVHLEIQDLIAWANCPQPPRLGAKLLRKVAASRMQRELQSRLLLPGLITGIEDLELIRQPASRANFVTRQRTRGPLKVLDVGTDGGGMDLEDQIVLIEGADPGYDWIFAHRIAGLITRFGGANSHMTIRCAEFGLPAAIGCGDGMYQGLKKAHSVELDCQGEIIRVLA